MMRTSGTCPSNSPGWRGGGQGGYTLLELVVVLALLGLATALVAPSGMRAVESWRRSTSVDAALDALASMSADAARQGRSLAFDEGPIPPDALEGLPSGWVVVLDAPLTVQANGACADTRGELRATGGYVQPFELHAPFCRARRAQAP